MSDIGTRDDPIFKGRTPGSISCAEFVRAVRRHAIVQKKARDGDYIADYAMSCLDGEALLWSEKLSTEIQGDWSLLRRALLAEYEIPNAFSSVTPPTSPATDAAPAAPRVIATPVNTPNIRRGRIRMQAGTVPVPYYICFVDEAPVKCYVTQDTDKAAAFELVEINRIIELRFTGRGPNGGSWLGMVWQSTSIKEGSFAALAPVERRGLKAIIPEGMPTLNWEGAVSVVKWTCSVDNLLAPILGIMEGVGIPVIYMRHTRGDGRHSIRITDDFTAFVSKKAWYKPEGVQFMFQPL